MGTNFYWAKNICGECKRADPYSRLDPEWHIGKRSVGFTFAQPPDGVVAQLKENANVVCVEDEYGQRYKGAEFLAMLKDCTEWRTECIGVWFS